LAVLAAIMLAGALVGTQPAAAQLDPTAVLVVTVDKAEEAIRGTVATKAGAPSPPVQVDLFEAKNRWVRGAFLESTTTSDKGDFGFAVKPGCYIVVAIAPNGYTFDNGGKFRQIHVCVEGKKPPGVITVSLEAGAGLIEGTVATLAGGVPLEGVRATNFEAVDEWTRGAFLGVADTDAAGTFVFDVIPGCYIVVVAAPEGTTFENGEAWSQTYLCVDEDSGPGPELLEVIDERTPDVFDFSDDSSAEPPGVVTAVQDVGLGDLTVAIDSSGGIGPWDVDVHSDPISTAFIGDLGASPVYEISVRSPQAMNSATLTLPFDDGRLGAASVADLHVATFDDDAQLWVPVASPTTVDAAAGTVTVDVDDFSPFVVTTGVNNTGDDQFFWSAEAIEELYGNVPVRCVAPGDAPGFDVVFAVDNSGSMVSNDPTNQRVVAAQAFLDRMIAVDRAAVVSFSDPAEVRLGLTGLRTGRSTVEQVLDGKADAELGVLTDLSGALERSIELLEPASSDDRVKVVLLLSDGVHQSDTNPVFDSGLIGRAARRGIAVYTVALGTQADRTLLREIADGTGARALRAADADQLVAIYDELADDLIETGVDSDGDTLTDCEERNGLFSPYNIYNPFTDDFFESRNLAVLSFTDPNDTDSDNDGTPDGVEVERRRLDADPGLASAYRVLIDQGRTTYFRLITGRPDLRDTDGDGLEDPVFPALRETCASTANGPSPFDWDTDLDGTNDFLECVNGTDPLVFDARNGFGVPGLAETTLFAPEEYDGFGFARPPVPSSWVEQGGNYRRVQMDERPVYYDADYNCVSNCTALVDWAASVPDDNGLGVCIWGRGDCVDDAAQIRDKVRGIVAEQNVFRADGLVQNDFVGFEAFAFCQARYDGCQLRQVRTTARTINNGNGLRLERNGLDGGTTTIIRQEIAAGRVTANADYLTLAAAALIQNGYRVYRDSARDPALDRDERVRRIIRTCVESPVLGVLPVVSGVHPCEVIPVFLPSVTDAGEAAQVVHDHIYTRNIADIRLIYQPPPNAVDRVKLDLQARGVAAARPREWYNNFSGCTMQDRDVRPDDFECQEYPYFSSTLSGPGPGVGATAPRASIRLVDGPGNEAEGIALSVFTNFCPDVIARRPYAVLPQVAPGSPPTDFVCRR
jgi:hypothetical protein